MSVIHAAYAGIFVLTFFLFVHVETASDYEGIVVMALITALSLIIMIIDYRRRVTKRVLAYHAFTLVAVNATLLLVLYLSGFGGSASLLVPVFMTQGALLYWSLERKAVR